MFYNSSEIKIKRSLLTSLLLGGIVAHIPTMSHARNGFIPHYVGAEGMVGGAGTACPLDATSTIANPAALGKLNSHFIFNVGLIYQDQYLNTSQSVIGNPIGKQKNQIRYIFPLTLGANIRFNEKWALGFMATGGGGAIRYNDSVTNPGGLVPLNGGFNKQTVNTVTLTATTLSYSPTPSQSYGISLLVATSIFKSDMAMPDGTQVTGRLSSDMVYGAGTRIGGIWDLNRFITLGASVATPVYSQTHKKYDQLFGAHSFQIPATARLGVTWHITPATDFSFDLKELFYGYSKWVRRGQGWRNQFIILTGIMHRFNDNFTAGVGYNYGKTPIRNDKVVYNALSIPLDEHHLSGGIRYTFDNKKTELFLMGYYIPHKKMTDNGQGFPFGLSKGIEIDNTSSGLEVGVKYNF